MKTDGSHLIKALETHRAVLQLSDKQFSRQVLGISPSYWCRLKTGTRSPSLPLLTLIAHEFPELTPEVTKYIMRHGNDGQDGEMPEKRHDKSSVSEENHTPHAKLARKPSKSAQCR